MIGRSAARSFVSLALVSVVAGCGPTDAPPAEESFGEGSWRATLRDEGSGPRVLVVVAHPDDEILFGGVVFKVATHLDGTCDLLTLTNGEGGFKYSTLAEHVYGLELTDEAVGRAELPRIRAEELRQSARILGFHQVESLGEWDHRYTQDVGEVLGPDAKVWDVPAIARRLDERLAHGYDFVLTMMPTATTHAHHQASALLTYDRVAAMPESERPDVLCARTADPTAEPEPLGIVTGYPNAALRPQSGPYVFDRNQTFGHRERLSYQVLIDMAIGAHLSQGSMQLLHGSDRVEEAYLVDLSPPGAHERVKAFYARLAEPQFDAKIYGASAGTNASGGGR